jgi:hypothetical protein
MRMRKFPKNEVPGLEDCGLPLITLERCEGLPTHRLLAYYKKYRQSLCYSYDDGYDEARGAGRNAESWTVDSYLDAIKTMLNGRGHVVRPPRVEAIRKKDNDKVLQLKRFAKRMAKWRERNRIMVESRRCSDDD